jgi:hypothetical protein
MSEKLMKEINNLEICNPKGPDKQVMVSEQVIGVVPEDIKKVYLLRDKYIRRREKLIYSQESTQKKHELFHEYERKIELLSEILWVSLKDEFSQFHTWDCKNEIAIREGWKVVISKSVTNITAETEADLIEAAKNAVRDLLGIASSEEEESSDEKTTGFETTLDEDIDRINSCR